MITLYGAPASRAHRVMWMLKEQDLPFTHIPTDFLRGGTRTHEFLRINPNGRVPVLDDEGRVIFESMAINLYLAKTYGGAVAAKTAWDEAQATQWSFWAVTEVEKPLLLAAANLILFAPPDRNADELTLMRKRLDRPFKVLEAHLAARDYLLGGCFTVADLNVAAMMSLVPLSGLDLSEYPRLARWLHICLERPAAADWKPIKFTVPRPPAHLMLASFV
ncbi:MAG: glutathione S-transferase family protein [Acidocella sp.]|nr:glutathione S-transferase family protein [Acidocella sp.]